MALFVRVRIHIIVIRKKTNNQNALLCSNKLSINIDSVKLVQTKITLFSPSLFVSLLKGLDYGLQGSTLLG